MNIAIVMTVKENIEYVYLNSLIEDYDLVLIFSSRYRVVFNLLEKMCDYGDICIHTVTCAVYRSFDSEFSNNREHGFYSCGLEDRQGYICINKRYYNNISDQKRLDFLFIIDIFLKKIIMTNCDIGLVDIKYLFPMLHNIFSGFRGIVEKLLGKKNKGNLIILCNKIIFSTHEFYQRSGTNNPQPLISVIMPSYNNENYILDSVWSVLKQSFSDFELIVVNEAGSYDHTVSLIRLFADERIRIIQNTDMLGLANSLNRGISKARGDYIARMDADDICRQNRFELQWKHLETYEELDLLGGSIECFKKSTSFICTFPILHPDIFAQLMFHLVIAHSTVMFRKRRFADLKLYYDSASAGEDYELWIRARKHIRFANLKCVLVNYRLHGDNITKKKCRRLEQETNFIMLRLIMEDFGITIPDKYQKYINSWINYHIQEGKHLSKETLDFEKKLLIEMWEQNKERKNYEKSSLKKALEYRWKWVNESHGERII